MDPPFRFLEARIRLLAAVLIVLLVGFWALSGLVPDLRAFLFGSNFVPVLTLVVLLYLVSKVVGSESGTIFVNQDAAARWLLEWIERERPGKADLLEYSSETVTPLLRELTRHACAIRLLVKDPKSAVTPQQQARIEQRIHDLCTVTFKNYARFELRVYDNPGSLRGQSYDDRLLSIGWYTYSFDSVGVWGHTNPIIVVRVDSAQGRALYAMFRRTFEELWSNSSSVDPGAFSTKQVTEPLTRA